MKPIVIHLNEDVVISDPSKELGKGNSVGFDNVKPGKFYVFHKKYNCGIEGEKIGQLMVIHEEHLNDVLPWVKRGLTIKSKSGLAGIFTKDTYRKDDIFLKKSEYTKGLPAGIVAEGGDWYGHMIERTNTDKHGTYFKGCVCMTPGTEKEYEVHVARFRRRPVGIMIDFGMDNTRYAKYDWWLDNKPVTAL
jgi:hypothetical protein